MITKLELIEYLKHTPENTNYNILYSSLYNGSNKEAVDEFIEVLSRGNLSLAALQPYLAKLYEDDKTISPDPLPPFSSGGSGGSGGVLIVNITNGPEDGLLVADKTVAEIIAAARSSFLRNIQSTILLAMAPSALSLARWHVSKRGKLMEERWQSYFSPGTGTTARRAVLLAELLARV